MVVAGVVELAPVDRDLLVDGDGPVQFSNNNSYTGDTSIGIGQGAAVARVTRSRPFGTNGTVTIGPEFCELPPALQRKLMGHGFFHGWDDGLDGTPLPPLREAERQAFGVMPFL